MHALESRFKLSKAKTDKTNKQTNIKPDKTEKQHLTNPSHHGIFFLIYEFYQTLKKQNKNVIPAPIIPENKKEEFHNSLYVGRITLIPKLLSVTEKERIRMHILASLS